MIHYLDTSQAMNTVTAEPSDDHVEAAMIDLQQHRAIRQLKLEINTILRDLPAYSHSDFIRHQRQTLLRELADKCEKLRTMING